MDSEKTDNFKGFKLGLFVFESVMAVVYLAVSVIFIFTTYVNSYFQQGMRIVIGILFGLYGLFRVYRAYRKITQNNE